MKPDRRTFIMSLASSAALAACSGGKLLPQNSLGEDGSFLHGGISPDGLETIPMKIINNTGTILNKNVWFLLYGQGVAPDDTWYHVTNANGKIAKCVSTNDKYSADYSFNLANTSTIQIPTLRAARLYISFNKKLFLQVNNLGVPTPPAGYNADAANVNYNTVWDFVEWTYNPSHPAGSGWNGNLTLVDSVNIPIDFRIIGTTEAGQKVDETRGFMPGGYTKFINSLKTKPAFAGLILPKTQRVLAPNIGTLTTASPSGPVFNKNYFDMYINSVWKKYQTETLKVQTNLQGLWTGKVVNGQMVFTQQNGTPKLNPIKFKKPTTVEVFACANICVNGCGTLGSQQEDVNNQIRAALLAAFNRSTLLTNTTLGVKTTSAYCQNTAQFYQSHPTNYYAKFIHANTKGNLAYCFGIDDTCDQSSFVAVRKPQRLEITLIPK